jgi:hypothetical protein
LFGGQLLDKAGELWDDLTGETTEEYATSPDGRDKVKNCTAQQVLTERRCSDLKVLVISAERMPFIARNIQLAWGEGIPAVLTRNSAKQAANRAAACGKFVPKYPKESCDEYAFATTDEGGASARTEGVPLREQRCQGGAVTGGYAKANIQQGEQFLVVIAHPASIASKPYVGDDIAEDQATCES